MADIVDRASERIEIIVEEGRAKCSLARSLIAVRFCHYCGEAVDPGRLFCDSAENDCAKDWEYEQARKKANGT